MTPPVQVPTDKCAFDHPETRRNWQLARLRAGAVLPPVVMLLLATLVVMGMLGDRPTTQPMWMRVAGLVCVVAAPFVFAFALYSLGPVLRLRRIRKVLREYPWEYRASIRPAPGVKDAALPVRVRTDADGDWSRTMRAINPLQRKRWTGEMEHGAWFAGDPEFGGVIAAPGATDFMTLERGTRTPPDLYGEITRDKARMARAKRAGIAPLGASLRA
ncbi:hypothetical protein [Streptomyces fulvoviolaceus]|uniref:hypothetical protein n=1 Tax=Streptomyces fulvoviolaceus TaxID=285535 RepID=UPI0004C71D0E|nr:hypothetical protein [Streptomyces fulvoviolaceus]MCT9081115.1 hypothetical protein [Streptomyces fulvoviolaceus]